MRLPPDTRRRLQRELDQLRHLTRAEQRMRADCRQSGTVKRSDVRDLARELSGVSGEPTPTERELINLVNANQR